MAGSYNHMVTKSGRLRGNESFCGMIENLGDAYEAAEECYGMIWYLARSLEAAYRTHPTRDGVLAQIEQARQNYKDGLRFSREV